MEFQNRWHIYNSKDIAPVHVINFSIHFTISKKSASTILKTGVITLKGKKYKKHVTNYCMANNIEQAIIMVEMKAKERQINILFLFNTM